MKTLRAAARAARRQGQLPQEDGARLSQDGARLSQDGARLSQDGARLSRDVKESPTLGSARGSSTRQGRATLKASAVPGSGMGAVRPSRFSGEFRLTGDGGVGGGEDEGTISEGGLRLGTGLVGGSPRGRVSQVAPELS